VTTFDAMILAGGRGTRLGGVDKASLSVGGATLLDTVVASVDAATRVICVGPERPTVRPVMWTRERPPGGGPVAALAAGLHLVEAEIVVVLAVDLPFITPEAVSSLVELCGKTDAAVADAAVAEDGDGIHQPLLAAYRTDALRTRLIALGGPAGASMKALLEGIDLVTVPAPDASQDLDTPADLDLARAQSDLSGDR
jgi:molybdopterin-guanine dinucleotide biosynthesis protein A